MPENVPGIWGGGGYRSIKQGIFIIIFNKTFVRNVKLSRNENKPDLTPIEAPSASNCSEIWKASSRVGVSTRANSLCGFSRRLCRMGSANAPVFPDPVSARPIMSLPECHSKGIEML